MIRYQQFNSAVTCLKRLRLLIVALPVVLATMVGSLFAQTSVIAISGEPAPGAGSGVIFQDSHDFNATANNVGGVAFTGFLQGPGVSGSNDSGTWVSSHGTLGLVAREGATAPGTDPGVVFSPGVNMFSQPQFSDAGHVAIATPLSGPGVNGSNDRGIWAGGSGTLDLVAREGSAAPGTGPGVLFHNLQAFPPVLNQSGAVAFAAFLEQGGTNSQNDSGIWAGGPGTLGLVAREGFQAPGTNPGVVFTPGVNFANPQFSDAGQVAIAAPLSGPGVNGSNDRGIWAGGSGTLDLVAREGSAAPGTGPGVLFHNLQAFPPVLNQSGAVAFAAFLEQGGTNSQNDSGIWAGGPGTLGLVAREGFQAPGTNPGVVFTPGVNFANPQFSDAGQVAIAAPLSGPGVNGSNDRGIWAGGSGTLDLVAREGSAAPGTGPGVLFHNLQAFPPVLNQSGAVAFAAFLEQGGTNSQNDSGIWAGGPGTLGLVAREGSAAPGTSGVFAPGVNFQNPLYADSGAVAFSANLGIGVGGVTPANDFGIWVGGPGSLGLAARERTTAPGTGPGVIFHQLFTPQAQHLNNNGQLVFSAFLEQGGVTSQNDQGVWVSDGIDTLLAVREGDTLAGRTIRTISIIPGVNGKDINDFGQVAYQATFTDSQRAIAMYTPELNWRGTAGDNQWDSTRNFTLSINPAHVHNTSINPSLNATIIGPSSDTTVRSLTIGGGAGDATLQLQPGVTLTVLDGLEIASNGTLSGSGPVVAAITVDGTISPGDSPGTMPVIGNVVWAPGGTYLWEVNDAAGAAGSDPGWDLLDITGNLNITATSGDPFEIQLTSLLLSNSPGMVFNFNDSQNYSWTIATVSGSIFGFDESSFFLNTSGFTNPFNGVFGIENIGNDINLTFTSNNAAVPEPTSFALLAMGTIGMVGYRWRRRKRIPNATSVLQ